MWEWNWNSIARECPRLARDGYDGVQVAPPQNSVKRTATEANNPGGTGSTVLHPRWEVYQVVSYDLTSQMGNEAQFKSMVGACRRAGVKVYVESVGTSTSGSAKRTNFYTDDFNVIAFRKGRGWVAFNNGATESGSGCRPGCREAPTATSSPVGSLAAPAPERRSR